MQSHPSGDHSLPILAPLLYRSPLPSLLLILLLFLSQVCSRLGPHETLCTSKLAQYEQALETALSQGKGALASFCQRINWCVPEGDYFNVPALHSSALMQPPSAAAFDTQCSVCQVLLLSSPLLHLIPFSSRIILIIRLPWPSPTPT